MLNYSISHKSEMDGSNNKVCRLCLEITPTCECEIIEEIEKELLEYLQININLNVSDSAVACKSCLERLQDCLELKSRCFTVFMNVDKKVDIETGFQREVMSNDNVCLENSQVCPLCMSLIEDKNFRSNIDLDGVLLRDMVKNCLPELDLNIAQELLICKLCLNNIKAYYEFMRNCQVVEQRIEHFCEMVDHGSAGKVNLEDMLKFKDRNTPGQTLFIKKEHPDVEEAYVDVKNSLKSDEISCIKREEIDIKDELDIGKETTDSDDDNFGKNDFFKINRKISKNKSKGKEHFYPSCPQSSLNESHIDKNMQDNVVRKCFLCPFTTSTECLLVEHMKTHRGPTGRQFGCPECPYETDIKWILLWHILKHKDISQVERHKRAPCPFKSKYKSAEKLQHDMNKEMYYKCKECPFSTKYKTNYVTHQLWHKNPEVPMHKCEKCMYKTKHKKHLTVHMLTHEEAEVVNKFKCDKCSHWAKSQRAIKKHMVVHSDRRPYSCDRCSYSAKFRGCLVRHERVHQKDHELDHSKQPTFKCEQCNYSTKYKGGLKRHQVKHMELEEIMMYYCAICHFKTKYKDSLRCHLKVCLKRRNDK